MSDEIRIECRLISPAARAPTKAYPTDAAYDVYACTGCLLPPRSMTRVPTGVAVAVPAGYYISVKGRSGLSLEGIDVFGGTIDATYTGELMATMINNTDHPLWVNPGDRIAQILVHKCEPTTISLVKEFSPEYRGRDTKGWGSSGR